MSTAILAAGLATTETFESLSAQAEFRKASRNMLLSFTASQTALQMLPSQWLEGCRERLAIVLGTSHGELDNTIQFLSGLGVSGIARPFLFQSSLHNATLGFLSQRLGIRGPGFTLSHRFFSGEDGLDLGMQLIEDGLARYCLVIGVDSQVPGFESVMASTYPAGLNLGEGAAAVVLGSGEDDTISPVAFLTGVERFPKAPVGQSPIRPDGQRPYYDSNAVERLVRALAEPRLPTIVGVPKPDGSRGEILIARKRS